jgi:hypothetical protein
MYDHLFWKRIKKQWYFDIKDIPLSNWIEFNKTHDITILAKQGATKVRHGYKALESINKSFLKHFGVSRERIKEIKDQINLELMWDDYLITRDRSKLVFIQAKEQEMKLRQGKEIDYHTLLFYCSKEFGKIDTKNTTVLEFFILIKELNKAQKDGK